MMRIACLVIVGLVLTACVHFEQTYHFKETNLKTGEAVNFFRVTIEGNAQLSKARYVSGTYDERAIDLFFNEVKATAGSEADIEVIFRDDQTSPGTQTKIAPLDAQNGRQLMIFSTNAKAVADTIGQFSESQITADAITNLLNRRDLTEARRSRHELCEASSPRATALTAELTAMVTGLPADAAPDPGITEEQSLRILSRIARELSGSGHFSNFEEATAWFDAFTQGRSK